MKLILSILLLANVASAQNITIVHVQGQYAMTPVEVSKQVQASLLLLKQAGLRPKVVRIVPTPDIAPIYTSYLSAWYQLIVWQQWAMEKGYLNDSYVHFVITPWRDGGKLWVGGMSKYVCSKGLGRVSLSNATARNSQGKPRYNFSLIAHTHELAHQFGARHINSGFQMMRPAFNDMEVNGPRIPPWNKASIRQISRCMH
jgi:hypothetical protein